MSAWKTLAYWQKGASHEKNGTNCQDSVRLYENDNCIVAALADGLGSLRYSEAAAQTAVNTVCRFFEQLEDPIASFHGSKEDFAKYILNAVVNDIKDVAADEELPLDQMDCTLLFVCILKKTNRAIIGRLGDSAVCIMADHDSIAINDGNRTANGTNAILDADALEHFNIRFLDLDKRGVRGFILTSDGLENELYIKGSDHVNKAAELYFNAWFAGKEPRTVIEQRIRELTGIEGGPFDDDISIAVLSRADAPFKLPEDPTWLCSCGFRNPLQVTYCRNCGRDFSVLYQNVRFRDYGGKSEFFKQINQYPDEELKVLGIKGIKSDRNTGSSAGMNRNKLNGVSISSGRTSDGTISSQSMHSGQTIGKNKGGVQPAPSGVNASISSTSAVPAGAGQTKSSTQAGNVGGAKKIAGSAHAGNAGGANNTGGSAQTGNVGGAKNTGSSAQAGNAGGAKNITGSAHAGNVGGANNTGGSAHAGAVGGVNDLTSSAPTGSAGAARKSDNSMQAAGSAGGAKNITGRGQSRDSGDSRGNRTGRENPNPKSELTVSRENLSPAKRNGRDDLNMIGILVLAGFIIGCIVGLVIMNAVKSSKISSLEEDKSNLEQEFSDYEQEIEDLTDRISQYQAQLQDYESQGTVVLPDSYNLLDNGDSFWGELNESNQPEGLGVLLSDSNYYIGNFTNGKKNGEFNVITADQVHLISNYSDDELISETESDEAEDDSYIEENEDDTDTQEEENESAIDDSQNFQGYASRRSTTD